MKDSVTAAKLLNNLRTKYRGLNQVFDLTKELDKAFGDNDEANAEIIIDMRQKQFELCIRMDQENEELLSKLEDSEAARAAGLVFSRGGYSLPADEEEEQLLKLTKSIKSLQLKTMELDEVIRNRLGK